MASSYPGGLDNFTNPTASDTLDSATVPHASQHANANDAIEAIESTLGVNPQGSSATVVARLTALDSTVAGKAGLAIANTFATGAQLIKTGLDTLSALILQRNSATQSANIVSVLQSDGTTEIARMRPNGQLGVGALVTNATLGLDTTYTGDVRFIGMKQFGAASANAIELLNSSNTILFKVDGTGAVTAPGFTGPLTGNVTGNVSGNAGTVTNGVYTTTTSLPNVTSVNSTTIPASATLLTSGSSLDPTKLSSGTAGINISGNAATVTNGVTTSTTSLPNVTSVNSTTIPASATLLTSTTGAALGTANSFTTGTQTIATGSDATVGLRVKRNSATQSANIVEVTQSDGTTILAKIDASGNVTAGTITPTTQLAANTTSTAVPAVVVAPKGSFTVTGLTATHSGGSGVAYDTITGFTTANIVGLYVGQSVTLSGFSNANFNSSTPTTIQSVFATSIRVISLNSTDGTGTGGKLTASGTQQNLQEWQRTDGTVLTAINPAGGIVTPLVTGIVHANGAGTAFTSSLIADADVSSLAAIASSKLSTQRSPSSPVGAIEPIPRYAATSSTGARNNGYIPFTGFYADKTYNITASSTVLFAGAVAAVAGTGSGFITRVVLMSVSGGTYSVIARTGNISAYYASGATTTTTLSPAGLLSVANVVYTGTFDATATLTEGNYYMIGVIQYASTLGTATFASLASSNMNSSGYAAAGNPGLLVGQYQPGTAADVTTSTTFTAPTVLAAALWARITP
jgi:hypothetical protein